MIKSEPRSAHALNGIHRSCPYYDHDKRLDALDFCPYKAKYCAFKAGKSQIQEATAMFITGHPLSLPYIHKLCGMNKKELDQTTTEE
jgi:hypothetical protein